MPDSQIKMSEQWEWPEDVRLLGKVAPLADLEAEMATYRVRAMVERWLTENPGAKPRLAWEASPDHTTFTVTVEAEA